MVKKELIDYFFKRSKTLVNKGKGRYYNILADNSINHVSLLTQKDLRILNLFHQCYTPKERQEIYDEVDKKLEEYIYEKMEKQQQAYEKNKKKKEKLGEEFKKIVKPGNVVEVDKGFMYVIMLNKDTFLGQYVYRKLDMPHNMYKKKANTVTEKMYKFIKRIVQEEIKLLD